MSSRPPAEFASSDKKKWQRAASLVLNIVLIALALWVIREFIPAIVWAAVIAIALWPALLRLTVARSGRAGTTLVALGLTLAVGLFVVLPFAFLFAQTLREAHDLLGWFKAAQANGIPEPDFLARLPFATQIHEWWQANLAQPLLSPSAMGSLHGQAVVDVGRHFGALALRGIVHFGFMLLTLFVLLQVGPRLSEQLLKAVRGMFGAEGAQHAIRMAAAVRGTVSGLVVVGLGEGVLIGVAYVVTGVPHAAVLGLLTAVAAMLPFCAPIVFCGAVLWLFLQGSMAAAVGVLVWGVVIVFIADHFVRPILIGSATRLPFLLVLFGILGGAQTFGLVGLFIGPALMTVLAVMWRESIR
ncbi:AI-2E family transporter [Trinickia fusca]|uniref:AI-2E family transporter n=1 Tax=Trinickia fusca TaxID=2419777 RepID=A0A494XAS3_9BURK|nr:AI-2E family transporter [Trinickia fusca]RKP45189.1 AI-2E family transporter [Trinickia fusca]